MAAADREPPHGRVPHRLRTGQLLAIVVTIPVVMLLAAVVVGITTVANQSSIRGYLLRTVEPANGAALRLATAVVNQETGIRGYELTGRSAFLQPYTLGVAEQHLQVGRLRNYRVHGTEAALAAVLARIADWQTRTAMPAIARVSGTRRVHEPPVDASVEDKDRFDAIRSALDGLQNRLSLEVTSVKRRLADSARSTQVTLGVIAGVLLVEVLAGGLALRRLVSRPIGLLTNDARRVAGGELSHRLELSGPFDIEQLARDVDAMRRRLLAELEAATDARNQLAETAIELERSNAELEQFAYVASHDLQEPLRKVASFCEMLQQRYADQLDERANQYIDFAVDGAVRMQQLVGDLLSFSRVGRRDDDRVPTDLTRLARAAVGDLQAPIAAAGAEVTVGELPTLPVEPSLMRTVFQNLVANAVKFRAPERQPTVELDAELDGDRWIFSCTDNGIGIDAEYADRIFVIFQRLHARDRYPGTGIGLAMCRKIVEHHGGSIWLDTTVAPGTRVCFTLPAPSETMAA